MQFLLLLIAIFGLGMLGLTIVEHIYPKQRGSEAANNPPAIVYAVTFIALAGVFLWTWRTLQRRMSR
jgi:UPF0716 family protein affecting phage T7 exclusion